MSTASIGMLGSACLRSSAFSNVTLRALTKGLLEVSCEVTLIHVASSKGHVDQRHASKQQFSGVPKSYLCETGVEMLPGLG